MKKLVITLGILTSLMFTGCGGSQDTTQSKAKEDVTQSKIKMDSEQELKTFLGAEPKTIDPSKATDSYASVVTIKTTEPLTTTKVDDQGNETIVPAGAESWTVSDDQLTYTFKIRKGMVWSDDKPVTAKDYYYGAVRTLDPKTGSIYAFLMSPIKNANEYNSGKAKLEDLGIKLIDDYTIQFTLAHATPYFLQLTYRSTFFPQRQDMVEKFGDTYGSEANTMLSCGPYILTEWTHGNKAVFDKNPKYWDSKNVFLTKITQTIVNDENSRMNLMYNGQVDIGAATKPEWVDKFEKSGDFLRETKYELGTNYNYFNQNSKYLKNAKIRRALSLAINREEVNNVMFQGKFEPAYGFVAKGISIGDKLYNSEPLKELAKVDPKQLLLEGLKELGLPQDPSQVTITYLAAGTSGFYRKYAEYMQQSYKETLGINLKAEFVTWPVFQKQTQEGDYELAGAAWSADYNDPNTFLDMFLSTSEIVPTGYNSPEFDALIAKASTAKTNEERNKIFLEAEKKLVVEDAVVAPTLYRTTNSFVRKYVKGYSPSVLNKYNYKGVYISGRE